MIFSQKRCILHHSYSFEWIGPLNVFVLPSCSDICYVCICSPRLSWTDPVLPGRRVIEFNHEKWERPLSRHYMINCVVMCVCVFACVPCHWNEWRPCTQWCMTPIYSMAWVQKSSRDKWLLVYIPLKRHINIPHWGAAILPIERQARQTVFFHRHDIWYLSTVWHCSTFTVILSCLSFQLCC